jgi:signal transduction histidine kinase
MKLPAGGDPPRWYSEIVPGLYRTATLAGVTGVMPAVAVAAGIGFSRVAPSFAAPTAPLAGRAAAALGAILMVTLWAAIPVFFVLLFAGQGLCRAARRLAERWLGVRIEVAAIPVRPVTRMATGYWWDGREYHRSERDARRHVETRARFAQLYRDGRWLLILGVTVLPVVALPLAGLAGGVYLTLTPGLLGYGVAVIAVSLAGTPFAWKVFGPVAVRFLGPDPRSRLGQRVRELEAIRADLTQTQAAELERIERGLHDGAQARLVAMGMSVQAAERLVDADPATAKAILAEARVSSVAALAELRSLVRGINPPVLAERGLVDAVRALALDAPVEVTVHSTVPARPERPVESAIYFAVAELLTNVAKHAHATQVTVELGFAEQILTATVTDDGIGGAAASAGSGLSGIERRMAAFGGRLGIDSPAGGPTRITAEVPCASS